MHWHVYILLIDIPWQMSCLMLKIVMLPDCQSFCWSIASEFPIFHLRGYACWQ